MSRFSTTQGYSLRLLLTLLMLAGIVLSVGISSGLSTRDAKVQIEELFDAQMLQSAKILELFYHHETYSQGVLPIPQILHVADSQISSFAEKADALKLAYEHKLAFQIWTEAEQLVVLSDNIGQQPITEFDGGYHKTQVDG
ncbi:MAG: ATP-binding protein, partial [Shewanella sp.]